ncbi:hypothetical protein WA026_002229 [Henosepilachna vigintioctopunctata]|uniref:Protein CASC3 n=1 Tax=Henosepilachna vigintioctopunctata TaxID=420089 RepID=A0AAW1TSY0_9CUCU
MEENPVLTNTIHTDHSSNVVEENLDLQPIVDHDKESPNETEYDSAGSYSEEREYKEKTDDSGAEIESDVEGCITLERQEGDGQESIPQKKVDDDEDKKNPQYIPKRGTFYEHDDRTADDIEAADAEDKEKQEKEGKKKLWQEKKERWTHDRFNDNEQIPKTKAELIQIYGYDIRNEDGPPRARRRRRYGRGPNKYTRNWEDEDAYNKPVPQRPTKKLQNPPSQTNEEFPPLDSQNKKSNKPIEPHRNNRENTNRNNWQNTKHSDEREKTPLIDHQQNINTDSKNKQTDSVQSSSSSSNKNSKVNSGNVAKSKNEYTEPHNIRDSDYKGFTTKMRLGRTNFKSQQNNNKGQKKDDFIESQNFSSRRINNNLDQGEQPIEELMGNMVVQDTKGQERSQGKGQNNQRQGSVPPRLQGEQKGSKRYSSIRQRSLPETNNPPILQHPSYYANELNQPQQAQGAVIHQNPNLLQTPAGITQLAAPPAISISQQVPVTATPILQAPPQFGPPFPQAPAFIQAAVPPPTYLPQQATPLINYVQTPPQYSAGYQGYQAPFNPVSQSTELYQPQGGITYYSTDQQIAQRIAPPKRPKAAIPIIAPPTFDSRKGEEERQTDYVSENNSVE